MSWRDRCVSAERAVSTIKPGSHVFVGSACATPRTLVHALETGRSFPSDVQLVHFLTDGVVPRSAEGARTRYQ